MQDRGPPTPGTPLPQAPPSRTRDAPSPAAWGRGCHPPPRTPLQPGSLLRPAPKLPPACLWLSHLTAPAPRAALWLSARKGTQTPLPNIPHLSLSAGAVGTHSREDPDARQAVVPVARATGHPGTGQPQHCHGNGEDTMGGGGGQLCDMGAEGTGMLSAQSTQ